MLRMISRKRNDLVRVVQAAGAGTAKVALDGSVTFAMLKHIAKPPASFCCFTTSALSYGLLRIRRSKVGGLDSLVDL